MFVVSVKIMEFLWSW